MITGESHSIASCLLQPGLLNYLESSEGDDEPLDQLTLLVYGELRRLAAGYLRNQSGGQTAESTALVHEAYLQQT